MAENDVMTGPDMGLAVDLEGQDGEAETRERWEELESQVSAAVREAATWHEENLEPEMVEATDYFYARPFGDEVEGRSKVVVPEVRDATLSQLPSLLEVVHGSERALEFAPRPREGEELEIAIERAALQSSYVDYVFNVDNPGFLNHMDVLQDGLVRRLGALKWWWEDTDRVRGERYTGLTWEDVLVFLQDPDVNVEILAMDEEGEQALFDARVTRQESEGRVRVASIPPEELIFSPGARYDLDAVPLIGHRRLEMPLDEIVALGYELEDIEKYADEATHTLSGRGSEDLRHARHVYLGTTDPLRSGVPDERTQRTATFVDAWALVDADLDRRAELRRFHLIGKDYTILNHEEDGTPGEIADEVRIAVFTPYPQPHTLVGLGNKDLLGDVQRVTSQLERGMLDSLVLSLEPDLEVDDRNVNLHDLSRSEIGRILRVRKPGSINPIPHQFLGGDLLAIINHQRSKVERSTGFRETAEGLNPKALQSTTQAGVEATITASQRQLRMVARVYAELTLKRAYMGILRLLIRNQDRPRLVRIGGGYVPVDPRDWDADLDVMINVGLGTATNQDRLALLSGIVTEIKEHVATGSPLAGRVELRRALAKATELAGFHADEFWRRWGLEEESELQQQLAQQPPPPDLEEMVLDIEKLKLQIESLKVKLQDERERMKIEMDDSFRRQKLAVETAAEREEVELESETDIEVAEIQADSREGGGD